MQHKLYLVNVFASREHSPPLHFLNFWGFFFTLSNNKLKYHNDENDEGACYFSFAICIDFTCKFHILILFSLESLYCFSKLQFCFVCARFLGNASSQPTLILCCHNIVIFFSILVGNIPVVCVNLNVIPVPVYIFKTSLRLPLMKNGIVWFRGNQIA